ncbi:plasmid replication protein, CyRepA1 family [Gluconobacter oxydans]|uniref:plasmid replication protein, CyRepA1 family n=1 Tax=Gluconobacter oxydans TaxID=442 RepID=UPI001CD8D002|nr:plasmid replication protein, CyRepA1 family [Gluconobacter oxydans]
MLRLFKGNPAGHGTYAAKTSVPTRAGQKVEIKKTARTIRTAPTADLWQQHLDGTRPLGIVPVMPDGTCHWAGIDIDKYDLTHTDIVRALAERDIPGIVCRSKSGGAHILFFFSEPIDAGTVKAKLKGVVADLGWPADTEVFPKQDIPDIGNWLNMPYFDADRGTRYAVREDGRGLSVYQFLKAAEAGRITKDRFYALNAAEASRAPQREVIPLRELTDQEKALVERTGATEAALRELDAAVARIVDTAEGGRNDRVFASSAAVGNLVGAGEIDRALAEEKLVAAGLATGLSLVETRQAVHNGLKTGIKKPRNAVIVDWKKAGILSRRVPFLADIDGAAQGSPVARDWVERLVAERKAFILSTMSIPPEARQRHRYEQRATLPDLTGKGYQGVIILRAPMGHGKTKVVGRRFADWAKSRPSVDVPDPLGDGVRTQKPGFIALCHRVTLTGSLSYVLDVTYYKDADGQEVDLATCLPSLKKQQFAGVRDACEYIFIDEVSQVLRFFNSNYTNSSDYEALKGVVRRAKCVIAADAGADARTVAFLEECRPGETFRIIDVVPAQMAELDVEYLVHSGQGAASAIWGRIDAELEAGERLWVSCETVEETKDITEHLVNQGRKVMGIWADNKLSRYQSAFLSDPESESRKYDVVVHSPVISSGLSIEHRADEHFTLGIFIGAGNAITPADAAQMMRRVRYLKKLIVSVPEINNLKQRDDLESIMKGQWEAAQRTGMVVGSYDECVAAIRADDANSKADFGNGLLWILEAMGARIRKGDTDTDEVLADERKSLRKGNEAAYVLGVQNAAIIDESRFNELKRTEGLTDEQRYEMEAFRIREGLNVAELDDAAIALWDHGRGAGVLDRMASAVGIDVPDTGELTISKRKLWGQTGEAYRRIFAGVDLKEGMRLSKEEAQGIADRAWDERFLMAHLGVVPVRWRVAGSKRRTAYLEIKDIFLRLGLVLAKRRNPRAGTESYLVTGVDAGRQMAEHRWASERWGDTVSEGITIREPKKRYRQQPPLPFSPTDPDNDNPALWPEFSEKPDAPFPWMDINPAEIPDFMRNDPDFWAMAV